MHKAKHSRVGGRVQEEGDEGLGAGQQGGLHRGEEVGYGGEAPVPVLKGTGKSWCKCSAGSREEVNEVSSGGGAGGEAAGPRLPCPVSSEPVSPIPATKHPCLDSGGTNSSRGGATGAPQGVGATAEGDKGGAEELEAG